MQAVENTRKRATLIEQHSQLSIRRQCKLLSIPRSLVYYQIKTESLENQRLMDLIDLFHMQDPAAGSRRMSKMLRRETGFFVGRKRVRRLMRLMEIEAIYPRKRTTIPGGPSGIYPYLLKGLSIDRASQVWSADIAYVPMRRGFMCLFAIIDWYSRKIIDGELSTTLDTSFCLRCLKRALITYGAPEIMNTDQGVQFTSDNWIKCLKDADIKIRMDGKGRWVDNVMIERFWRSIKYEDIYLQSYETPRALGKGIKAYIQRYNSQRSHDSIEDVTPDENFFEKAEMAA